MSRFTSTLLLTCLLAGPTLAQESAPPTDAPASLCGNQSCEEAEDCASCEADCGPCKRMSISPMDFDATLSGAVACESDLDCQSRQACMPWRITQEKVCSAPCVDSSLCPTGFFCNPYDQRRETGFCEPDPNDSEVVERVLAAQQPRPTSPPAVEAPARASAPPPSAPAPSPVAASAAFDKVLIQLNWGDDNLLLGSGETRENSPDPNFSRCSRTQIDGMVGRDCSQGTSRLGLYKSVQIGEGFIASGALVLGLGVVTDPESSKAGNVNLYDLGSYVRMDKRVGDGNMMVEMYPVDARPLKLGFHPDIEWGSKDEFPSNFRRGAAPGMKVGVQWDGFYAFAGAKTTLIKSPLEVELASDIGNRILFSTRTFYGGLGGVGLTTDMGLSIEANGGFFHKGTLTKEGVLGKDIFSGGGSARVSYQQGIPIGLRIDSSLYQRDTVSSQVIEQEVYDGGLALAGTVEGTMRVQNLSDFERPGSTALEWSHAGHVGLKLKWADTRVHVEGRLRSLTHITAEVPGFFPYTTIPENAETKPEIQGLLSVDHRLAEDITVALTGGLRLPSTYRGLAPTGAGEDAASAGIRTVVVSEADAGGWYILPAGEDARMVYWGEIGAKWHPAPEFALMGEVIVGRDENRTQVERDSAGHAVRVFTQPTVVGINLLGQFLF